MMGEKNKELNGFGTKGGNESKNLIFFSFIRQRKETKGSYN